MQNLISSELGFETDGECRFPLTDLQEAYLVGRQEGFEMGGVSMHFYFEIDSIDLDIVRLEKAWNCLVAKHEMLRTVVSANREQKILENVPHYRFSVVDLALASEQEIQSTLDDMRKRYSHRLFDAHVWPLFDVRCTVLPEDRTRVHVSLDGLLLDMRSRFRLFHEWKELFNHPDVSYEIPMGSFQDYAQLYADRKETEEYRLARQYWLSRLDELPAAPELPILVTRDEESPPRYGRFTRRISAGTWKLLKRRASNHRIRPSILLLTAFSEVLSLWSTFPKFLLNLTLVDRAARFPEFADILGEFTTTSLLAVNIDSERSFIEHCDAIQARLHEDLAHSSFNGVEVTREIARKRTDSPGSIAPIVFTSILSDSELQIDPLKWLGQTVFEITQTPQVSIDLQVSEVEGSLIANFDMLTEWFMPEVPEKLVEAYAVLLKILSEDQHSWERNSVLLHRKIFPLQDLRVLRAVNNTSKVENAVLLHALVEEQALRTPDRPAVISEERTLDYRELTSMARRVGGWLNNMGVAQEMLVAVVMDKGIEQVTATLGVLYAGAAYLPLDPDLPEARLQHLIEVSGTRVIVARPGLFDKQRWTAGREFLEWDGKSIDSQAETVVNPSQDAGSLAYVVYTSGSTGDPKGVMIEHRSAANTVIAITKRLRLNEEDRVLALSPFGFDLSVFDIFGPLSSGGAVVIPASGAAEPKLWLEQLEQHAITTWNSTPELMDVLSEYASSAGKRLPSTLRQVMLSGDRIPVDLPDRIRRLNPALEVISLGGATEGSIWSILYSVQRVDKEWASIPYGRPLPGQEIHVVGSNLEPRPIGAIGEIAIGGEGLARGYWNDPDQTKQSFVIGPDRRRLYLTGDLGRLKSDGTVEILGRKDDQTKIRGYRVEPAEIEARMLRHPDVRAAYVFPMQDNVGGQRLVCFAVYEKHTNPEIHALKSFLAESLPAYMIPREIVFIDSLPVTPNGKVNRSALLRLQRNSQSEVETGDYKINPNLEDQISQIVSSLLNIHGIDGDSTFFELGADSLDMLHLSLRLESQLGIYLPMSTIYAHPTIRALASYCDGASNSKTEQSPKILDTALRDDFKEQQRGTREDFVSGYVLPTPRWKQKRLFKRLSNSRKSVRSFGLDAVPLIELSGVLSHLRQVQTNNGPKRLYASAGGLYPVQIYLQVKPGRVDGLPGGSYYYHPLRHQLMRVNDESGVEQSLYRHTPAHNRDVLESSAFVMFFIAQMDAIEPIYGLNGWHYSVLETGLITQLLENAAVFTKIGFCQIGDLNVDLIREPMSLDDSHRLILSMAGGARDGRISRREKIAPHSINLVTKASSRGQFSPVICLPGAGGFPIGIHSLAEQLGDDQPVYTVRYPGLYTEESPVTNLELLSSMIREQVNLVRGGQPWRLMGFSFGGAVAFEIARQALAQGEKVELLALIDAAAPDYLRAYPEKVESVLDSARPGCEGECNQTNTGELPSRQGIWETTRSSIEALCQYQPHPVDAHIVIVRASDNRSETEKGFDRWEPYALRGTTEVYVPGNKSSKFQGAFLSELGNALRELLVHDFSQDR